MEVIPINERGKRNYDRGVNSVLEIYNINTKERRVVNTFDGVIEAPNWTKDNKLIFTRSGGLYSFCLKTHTENLINTGIANSCNNDHVLSPEHTHMAVSHHTWEDGMSRIYTLPLSAEPEVTATLITPIAPSYLHGWSPDGKTLAYCAERNGQYDIYIVPANGGKEIQLTDNPGLDDGPEYSPCGKYIWFNSTRSGLMQVWRMDSDGKNPVQKTFDESNSWFPHVSPDGKHVVYITYKKGDVEPNQHPANKNVELRFMAADGGDYETAVSLFGGQGTINVNSWSPDSTEFAFVSYTTNFGLTL